MERNDELLYSKKKDHFKQMIEKGIQVPLNKLLNARQIQSLQIKEHAFIRYKQRFAKLHDIQIEQEIKNALLTKSVIVENGHSGRWLVYAKGFIFILDETTIYTTYDANGKDRNNILNPTKATLSAVNRKSKPINRINHLFELIQNNNTPQIQHS